MLGRKSKEPCTPSARRRRKKTGANTKRSTANSTAKNGRTWTKGKRADKLWLGANFPTRGNGCRPWRGRRLGLLHLRLNSDLRGCKAQRIREQLHSCAQIIRYAIGALRGPSLDFADKKAVLRAPPRPPRTKRCSPCPFASRVAGRARRLAGPSLVTAGRRQSYR